MAALNHLAINGDGFAFDPASGACYTMNGTAAFIVEAMNKGFDDSEIATALVAGFEVSDADAARDVADFRQKLQTLKLV